MNFERARRVADAVLLEGYVLYPYRASSTKNRYRFTFGVLAPRAWSEAGGCEAWWLEAQCLVERGGARPPLLEGKLRFLQACRRRVEEALEPGGPDFRPVESLDVEGHRLVEWDEGDVREVDFAAALDGLRGEAAFPFEVAGGSAAEQVRDGGGGVRARVVRERLPLRGIVRVSAEELETDPPLVRVRVRVENHSAWDDPAARRCEALRASCIGTHLVLGVAEGAFVSLLDPPPFAAAAAAACRSTRSWPVLVGEPGTRDLVLAAPIILYDHPQVAPESPCDLFDATEIDELLALRTATLTDDEKRDVRATDPRAAAILDRVGDLPPELLGRLHGTARDLLGAEMVPRARPAEVAGAEGGGAAAAGIGPGSRVRLRPGVRRADAQDLLYAGCTATVRLVRRDVDGRDCLAVTIDGDPAAELHDWYGRYHHFFLDEVEPLSPDEGREAPP